MTRSELNADLNNDPGGRPSSLSILKPPRNAWTVSMARRVSFLIDADAFFRAFAEACSRAEHEIFIIGWDTDSRTEIPLPQSLDSSHQERLRLGLFLKELTERKPTLKIHVLSWDFAFIYLFEREALPGVRFSALTGERIRFVLDREHPALASHHQKIVVVDDRIAFTGGIDITQRRWDTPEHLSHDERRVDPGGHSYGPFHDVQICVEGEIARAMGDIARERWELATGEKAAAPVHEHESAHEPAHPVADLWPPSARVAMTNVRAGISRTLPHGYRHDENGVASRPVLEVERLFVDSIKAARDFIYIENQYFTSKTLARALAARMREEDGPDVVLILPRDQTGWIEESTMGILRSEALRTVEEADRFNRFKCYYPVVPGLEQGYVKVHSKLMIVDDEFVRVGSSNMNARSMGVDTECDLSLEAEGRADVKEAIARVRKSLLCEHLGVSIGEFDARFERLGSLARTVESLRGGARGLIELRSDPPPWVRKVMPPDEWIDPRSPYGIRRWFAKKLGRNRTWLGVFLIAGVAVFLTMLSWLDSQGRTPEWASGIDSPAALARDAWDWVRSWDGDRVAAEIRRFRERSWAIPFILFGFVAGSFVFIPVTAMIVGVALTFPRWQAFALALGGSMIAAMATYGLGRYWAWSKSRIHHKPWARRLTRELQKGGVWAVTAVRLMPIAPFTAVSLVAGGLRVSIRDYAIGSFLGLLPGCLGLVLLSSGAVEMSDIDGSRARTFGWGLLVVTLALFFIPRWIDRYRRAHG